MSLVNFNAMLSVGNSSTLNTTQQTSNSDNSIFTPAPSVETAGSVASSAPAASSFSAVC